MISRRSLVAGAAAAAWTHLAARAAWARETGGAPAIGIQLYMIREAFRADPAGTLRRVKQLGFDEIEWWNWASDRPPSELRAMLDGEGLRSPSAHVDPADLAPAALEATLERAGRMGHRWLLVAWTPPEQRRTVADWQRLAALLSTAGARGAAMGIRTGYHNHDFDFARLGDTTPFDLLVRETDPRVVDFEVDCYWAHIMGRDPQALIRQLGARVRLLHLKDSGPSPADEMRDVGAGTIPWASLLRTAGDAGVRHAYVEHDRPANAWDSARTSRAYLRTLGY